MSIYIIIIGLIAIINVAAAYTQGSLLRFFYQSGSGLSRAIVILCMTLPLCLWAEVISTSTGYAAFLNPSAMLIGIAYGLNSINAYMLSTRYLLLQPVGYVKTGAACLIAFICGLGTVFMFVFLMTITSI